MYQLMNVFYVEPKKTPESVRRSNICERLKTTVSTRKKKYLGSQGFRTEVDKENAIVL